jgi:glyoxylase-like metal-dependent hydrolase (beta-lactamase superfamily II)
MGKYRDLAKLEGSDQGKDISPTLKIIPISTGRFQTAEKSNFTYGINQGVKIQAPILMWFIESPNKRILIDTGGGDPDWAARYHHPLDRKKEEDPINALKDLGLFPTDIDIIIMTHLHWDHSFNTDLFPNAKVVVQQEEVYYALNPLPCHALYYESQLIGMTPPWLKSLNRMEIINGEKEIEPGIRVISLPGHTPGFQGVLVDLKSGRCMIAGDTIPLWENWEPNHQGFRTPSGIHTNLFDYYNSFKIIESITDRVLPGHDMKVLEKSFYD